MGKKLDGKKLELLEATKDGFMIACKQYSRLGNLMVTHAKVVGHPAFKMSGATESFAGIIDQHAELGEQMKQIGEGLDSLGGKPVLEDPKKKKIRELNEMKKLDEGKDEEPSDEEVAEKMKETHDNMKFVSNIKPDEKDEK